MAAIDEVVGYGLREVFLIRQWALHGVEAVLKHQDVAEFMISISRLMQSHVRLALGLPQEMLEGFSFQVQVWMAEIEEDAFQLLLRRRAYEKAAWLG